MTFKLAASQKLIAAGAVAAVCVTLALVAIVRPGAPAAPEHGGEAASIVDEHVLDAAVEKPAVRAHPFGSEGPCSRPAAAGRVPAIAAADAAYDAGDYAKAKDAYATILLVGADFGGEADPCIRWCHGRLALAMAKLALPEGAAVIDEPPLLFEVGPR